MIAPAAHATQPSPDGAAKLTLSNGTPQKGAPAGGTIGGAAVIFNYVNSANDVAWAPDGSRAAWIDVQGDVVVATPGTGNVVQITPPNTAGAKRTHPAWIENGSKILWSEKTGAGNSILKTAYANGLDKAKDGTQIVDDFPTGLGAGDLEFPDASGSIVAFQFRPASSAGPQLAGTEVWVLDESKPGTAPYKVAPGFHPSVSADGKNIAFVTADANGLDQISSVPSANPNGTPAAPTKWTANTAPVATNPHPYYNPVWTPDGKSIVFESVNTGGQDADTKSVTAGSTAETSIAASPVTGLPAFQPQKKNFVARLAGTDRLDTAVKVAQNYWAAAGSTTSAGVQAKAVVLSRSDQFADALGGSALAAKVGGPLLLTQTAGLNAAASAEIQRVLGPGDGVKTVYVLGGEKALSPAVFNALTALHYNVKRVSGNDRYETAVAIADTITDNQAPDCILVATGQNYADALSAGAAAGAINAHDGKNAVVLLTNDKTMPPATVKYIAPLNNRTLLDPVTHLKPANYIELDSIGGQADYALGGKGGVGWIPAGFASGAYSAFTGGDRYQTSVLVAQQFFGSTKTAGVATGLNWADALSGGALMGTLDGPMVLIPTTGPTGSTSAWLAQSSGQLDSARIFGGVGAVAAPVDHQVGGMIGGPAGVDYPAANPRVS
jgi:putative cell wall-binding protein